MKLKHDAIQSVNSIHVSEGKLVIAWEFLSGVSLLCALPGLKDKQLSLIVIQLVKAFQYLEEVSSNIQVGLQQVFLADGGRIKIQIADSHECKLNYIVQLGYLLRGIQQRKSSNSLLGLAE